MKNQAPKIKDQMKMWEEEATTSDKGSSEDNQNCKMKEQGSNEVVQR